MAETRILDKSPRRPRITLSSMILLMMLLGALVGLFFGEMVGWLKELGNAVIQLMQMTILPYIVVSLIGGLGKLSPSDAKSIFSKAGIAMGLLWVVSLVFILLSPISFPYQESASFFSKALLPTDEAKPFIELYIPSNPFQSLASGAIPAVVLFSIAVGVALIGVPKKGALLESLESFSAALLRVNKYVTYTLPVGVFASTAGAAGTLTVEQFGTLQVFLVSFIVLSLLLTFFILPRLVVTILPFKAGDIVELCRGALVTAFATGNIFIVLPALESAAKELFAKARLQKEDTDDMVAVMLPLAFSFPNAGKLMVLLFVPFAGWFNGNVIPFLAYPEMAVTGLLSLFGSIFAAIPLLLENYQIPSDLFQLFIVSNFITSKFISLVAVMHMMVFSLLSVAAYQKQLTIKSPRILLNLVLVFAITIAGLLATRVAMSIVVPKETKLSSQLMRMKVSEEVPEVIYATEAEQDEQPQPTGKGLDGIRERGLLRVGYLLRALPFSYFNSQFELVGFDVALINKLAADLEVKIKFIPYQRDALEQAFEMNAFDIAIGGVEFTSEILGQVGLTSPVLEMHLSLFTEDYRLKEFNTLEKLYDHDPFSLAVVGHRSLVKQIETAMPNITIVELTEYIDFMEKSELADVLLVSAEEGYAWSILFPQFGVVIPKGSKALSATSFAVSRDRPQLLNDLNAWLELQRLNGEIQRQYDFWILGEGTKSTEPRWSIIRDVLGWVD